MKNNRIDVHEDSPIALTDVPNLLPKRRGKKVHPSTVFRWVTKGARGRVLESQLIGGIRYTTQAALNRFVGGATSQAGQDRQAAAIKQALYGES